jgi:hypothetical protein
VLPGKFGLSHWGQTSWSGFPHRLQKLADSGFSNLQDGQFMVYSSGLGASVLREKEMAASDSRQKARNLRAAVGSPSPSSSLKENF